MKGDVIITGEHHRRAAGEIAEHVQRLLQVRTKITLAVGGESGSGKSEIGTALAEHLEGKDVSCVLLQQDDYFVHPPKANDRKRRASIEWVGMQEVRLDLLDQHLASFRTGATSITKPLVIYAEDRIDEEIVGLEGARVVIAEGTYTTTLSNIDLRIFIDRTYLQTREDRRLRSREPIEPFLERVLEIEHGIIRQQRERADLVVSHDFTVCPSERYRSRLTEPPDSSV